MELMSGHESISDRGLASTTLFVGVLAVSVLSLGPAVSLVYTLPTLIQIVGLFIASKIAWDRELKASLIAAPYVLIYSFISAYLTSQNSGVFMFSNLGFSMGSQVGPIALPAMCFGALAVSATFEYSYRNREGVKELFRNHGFGYAVTAGILHLGLAVCMYITSYGPENVISQLYFFKILSGVAGSFLLTAVPLYLFLEEDMKGPLAVAGLWIVWGIAGFMQGLGNYPVGTPMSPTYEFILPASPGYIFSSFIPLSVILIIYEHFRQMKEE